MTVSEKQLPKLKKRIFSPKQREQPNVSLGITGEQQACVFLQARGYRIVAQNLVWRQLELDIIAIDQKRQELVFIEVKTRTNSHWGEGETAVNWKKLRAMQQAAAAFMTQRRIDLDHRFDIISVMPNGIEQFENVTWY